MLTNKIQEILTQNGDERIILNDLGLNYQSLPPIANSKYINRGTCTCSFSDKEREEIIENYYSSALTNGEEFYKNQVSERLRSTLNLDEKYEIFFAPSGTDLCYYPILFSCLLNDKSKKLLNIVTNIDELGSGVEAAYQGKLYFHHNDLIKRYGLPNCVSVHQKIDTFFIPSRNAKGNIHAKAKLIYAHLAQYQATHNCILNLNICSKSGISDDLKIIKDFEQKDNRLIVVDCCQFRNERSLIDELLRQNCMVMITGSKFFGAPPFCGALLVPQNIVNQLSCVTDFSYMPDIFTRIFSKEMFPDTLPQLKEQFLPIASLGLFTRWNLALDVMEQYFKIESYAEKVIEDWNTLVSAYLERHPNIFEMMPLCKRNFKSIISFRIKSPNGASYLSKKQLSHLRNALVTESVEFLGDKVKISIGQAVDFENGAFLRVAIGAQNIIDILNKKASFNEDLFVLEQIKEYMFKLNQPSNHA